MTISRRDLLALAALMPGFGALPRSLRAEPSPRGRRPVAPGVGDEDAWERLAHEFVIDGIHLNTGTYGACPLPVLEATIHHMRAFERITRQEHPDIDALHAALESFLGAWPGSVAIVRNTTEAMNVVANGLDLGPGDEILSTTHEHIGGRCCWELQAARRGAVLRQIDPILDPVDDDQQVAAWSAAITPRTRVMSISHVHFTTGLIQPVARLARLARERGIVSVIDGAHPPGMLALDLQAIDADFYASSPHKWLLAPKGTGLLVTRPDRIATTWPLVASGDWQSEDLRRFEHVGTSNESLVAGLAAAVQFQQAIGRDAIEARTRKLATGLDATLRAIPEVHVVSPSRPAHRSAIVSFTVDGVSAQELQGILGRELIRTRRISEFGLEYLRLSTHFFVLPAQIEKTVALIRQAIAERR